MPSERKATPKSIRTREAIETAARELFAAQGFERTTVRDIAARADIDPSMVIRYFGGKEALFAQVASPNLRLPDFAAVPPDAIGEAMVRHFLAQWEGAEGGGGLQVLLRSAASNEAAADRLRETFGAQVMPAVARVGSGETAQARAGLVATQLIGLAMSRYVLRLPPVVAMSTETTVRAVGATIQRYVQGDDLAA